MRLNISRPLVFLALMAVTGCVSIAPRAGGTSIAPEFVSTLVRGKTTADELRARLGPPTTVSRSATGSEMWFYSGWRGRPATFGSGYDRVQTSSLQVTLRAGILTDFTFSQSDSGRD
jgi:outer membrane protein assembly factor BamE (lipoprotein component of BamABCDE complex)